MNNKLYKILALVFLTLTPICLIPNSVFAADRDGDGIENQIDNCPGIPNGPILGTCLAGDASNTCTSNEECESGGFCIMDQEDTDPDGFGDVCDFCEGNGNYDTDEDGLCE